MVHAIGMKRAKDPNSGTWLWHSTDAGRLYESDTGYYFCATCDDEGRDPYIGKSGGLVTMTWLNIPPDLKEGSQ